MWRGSVIIRRSTTAVCSTIIFEYLLVSIVHYNRAAMVAAVAAGSSISLARCIFPACRIAVSPNCSARGCSGCPSGSFPTALKQQILGKAPYSSSSTQQAQREKDVQVSAHAVQASTSAVCPRVHVSTRQLARCSCMTASYPDALELLSSSTGTTNSQRPTRVT